MVNNSINIESDSNKTPKRKKFWKFLFVFILINLGILAIAARLVYIQIIESDKYREIARQQHEAKIQLRAERGGIFDRDGNSIVSTVQSISIAIDPTIMLESGERQRICKAIEQATGIPSSQLIEKINNATGSFVWLVRGLLPSNAAPLDTITSAGLIKRREPRRLYIYGSIASQLIGATDIDNNGIAGLEYSCDSLLRGKSGFMMLFRDALGRLRPSANLPEIDAVHGKSIKLTIDLDFQRIAEYELAEGVRSSNAASGTVIAMNPKTGEILAMATYPGFDPNSSFGMESALMKNRAINDVYEPGSTFKSIIASAAIEEGIIKPTTMVDGHNGVLDFGSYKIIDDHPLGKVIFQKAMEYSSDIVFSDLSNSMDASVLNKYVRDFGFGISHGIDLPAELSGKIKNIEELDEPTKRFLGFGYGIAVTPLQITMAYSALANDGVLMKPYVISEVYGNNGGIYRKTSPQKVRQVISKNTATIVGDLLFNVVENGTGEKAKVKGVRIAGKTGTSQQISGAQYSKEDYNASFAGYFPLENPNIVMVVLLDKPRNNIYGGSTAAPVFSNIVRRLLSVRPELFNKKEGTKKQEQSQLAYIPSFIGLFGEDASLLARLLGLSVRFQMDTSGIITAQSPKSGTLINKSDVITLSTSPVADSTSFKQLEIAAKNINVCGLSLRRGIAILSNAGIKVKVIGSGIIQSQSWAKTIDGETICTLLCNIKK